VVFLKDIEACDALEVQERYTALFDMSPSTTLNMTYHLWGDGEKRARLLTLLQQEYACADLEKSTSELPDYLPLILEYMATVPQAKRSDVIKKSLEGIDTLFERLKPVSPSYARLLAPLADMFNKQVEAPAAEAAR
jgi:nitrate reductase delta subunit